MEVPERYIMVKVTNSKGRTQRIKKINPEFVRYELAKEGCELVTVPHSTTEKFQYKYKNKIYTTKFTYWDQGSRFHQNIVHDGLQTHWNIMNNPCAFSHKVCPYE